VVARALGAGSCSSLEERVLRATHYLMMMMRRRTPLPLELELGIEVGGMLPALLPLRSEEMPSRR